MLSLTIRPSSDGDAESAMLGLRRTLDIASPALTMQFSTACVSQCAAMATGGSPGSNLDEKLIEVGIASRISVPTCAHQVGRSVTSR